MQEIENWNGHHVLAIPTGTTAELDPVSRAYAGAVRSLAEDLGIPAGVSRMCGLCPMLQAGGEGAGFRCVHPRGFNWTVTQPVDQGGCFPQAIVAEEYIPLVQLRLGGPA